MKDIIRINHLSKSFKDVKAVKDLSFSVKRGELFAFLGVNGAGKSTTISIMCGQLSKDNGDVIIDGINIDNNINGVKKDLGVVFQNSVLDKALSTKDNLKSRASLYGITGVDFEKRLKELDELFNLKDFINRPVGKLSGGQRRRVDIARALISHPKILILDEPTTGLDPQTRKMIWEIIARLRKEEMMTVFLTTHYMEEASEADYVIILDSGRIAAEGTPLTLKNKYAGDFITFYGSKEEEIKDLFSQYEKVADGFRVEITNTAAATELILKYPHLFVDYEITKGKMDDVFLKVTGKKLLEDTK